MLSLHSASLLPRSVEASGRALETETGAGTGPWRKGGTVGRVTKNMATIVTLVVATALTACSKKDNYGADTSAAAANTTSASSTYSASSTAPMASDTTATASATNSTTTKATTKKSKGKTAPKKATY